MSFSGGSVIKNPPANEGKSPESGRFPGEGTGSSLQYSYLVKSPKQRSLAGYSSWHCKELNTTQRLNNNNKNTHTHTRIHTHIHTIFRRVAQPRNILRKCHDSNQASQVAQQYRLCLQCKTPDQEDPLEEGMTTHPSILAWRIPWTEEHGRLQSIGSQRVRHDWTGLAHTHIILIMITTQFLTFQPLI